MDGFPVRFDISNIQDDPEYQKLVVAFVEARNDLSTYLNHYMDLTLVPAQKSDEETPAG